MNKRQITFLLFLFLVSTPIRGAEAQPIIVSSLDNVSVNSIGTLEQSDGGLPENMWNYTDSNYAFYLIDNLPEDTQSPTIFRTLRRLLLTKAVPPTGATENKDLFTARLKKLVDLGDTKSIREIVNQVPASEFNESYARLDVENLLLNSEYGSACSKTKSYIEGNPSSYWQKMNLFCKSFNEKVDEVELGVNLLSEQGEMNDMACCDVSLDNVLITIAKKESFNYSEGFYKYDDKGKISITNFEFALLQASKAVFTEKVIMQSTPAMQKAIALYSEATPLSMRILAGELALGTGAIANKDLEKIYDMYSWSGDINNVMAAPSLPLRRAALFQMIQKSSEPNLQVIQKLIDSFKESGMRPIANFVLAPMFIRLADDLYHRPDLINLAQIAVPILLASGNQNEAGSWYGLVELNEEKIPEAARSTKLLRPLVKGTIPVSTSWNPEFIDTWMENYNKPPAEKNAIASRLLTFVQAFRQLVPENAWNSIVINRNETMAYKYPPPALIGNLKSSSQKGQVAETVLLSTHILGDFPTQETPEDVIAEIIKALLAIDMKNEAQSLAVEALINNKYY